MNIKKVQVAKDFIANHKNNNVDDWFLRCSASTNNGKYLQIYDNLESGLFGECRGNAEFNDDCELVKEASEFEVEISDHESKTGNPIIFEWEL